MNQEKTKSTHEPRRRDGRFADFYRQMHASEVERKDRLDSAISFIATVLVFVLGLLGLLLDKHHLPREGVYGIVFAAVTVLAFFAVLSCVVLLALAWIRPQYGFAEYAVNLDWQHYNYVKKARESGIDQSTADADFWEDVIDMLVKSASENAWLNTRKSGFVSWARLVAVAAVTLALMASVLHFSNHECFRSSASPQEVNHNVERQAEAGLSTQGTGNPRSTEAAGTQVGERR